MRSHEYRLDPVDPCCGSWTLQESCSRSGSTQFHPVMVHRLAGGCGPNVPELDERKISANTTPGGKNLSFQPEILKTNLDTQRWIWMREHPKRTFELRSRFCSHGFGFCDHFAIRSDSEYSDTNFFQETASIVSEAEGDAPIEDGGEVEGWSGTAIATGAWGTCVFSSTCVSSHFVSWETGCNPASATQNGQHAGENGPQNKSPSMFPIILWVSKTCWVSKKSGPRRQRDVRSHLWILSCYWLEANLLQGTQTLGKLWMSSKCVGSQWGKVGMPKCQRFFALQRQNMVGIRPSSWITL